VVISILKVEDIHSYYGDSHVIQGISLEVFKGEIICLLGRNGAGKTTTMKSIINLIHPRQGRIIFEGTDITFFPTYQIIRMGIGFVPEDRRIFPTLTVLENLEIVQPLNQKKGKKWTIERIFREFPILKSLSNRKGGKLSGGEQQILAIARALLGNPKLLLLDEPCEGLAPIIVEQLTDLILSLKGEVTILLSEQNAKFAISVSDRGYVIEKGRIAFYGDIKELKENNEIKERYLAV